MLRGFRLVGVAAVIALLAPGGPGTASQEPQPREAQPQEPQPQEPQPPTFRASVNVVRVDVVATEKDGRQVSDLKAEDFEVIEEGKRQQIQTFKLITFDGGRDPGLEGAPTSISSSAVEQEEAARDDVRMFAIFLDDYHVSPAAGRNVREQVGRLVETRFGPWDLVGLMYPLTSLASVEMGRNRDRVSKIIREFEGRRGVNTPRNVFEENYVYKTGNVAAIRRDVSLSAIKGLITRMGGLKEGRKTLILVSEGYGSRGSVQDLREIADLASRNNTAIYPVTPRLYGPASQWMPLDLMDGLNVLAEHSGGRVIYETARNTAELRERRFSIGTPRSRLASAMEQILVDSSAFYLLGYASPRLIPDGKFHKVEVKVKRPGIQLRYRKGYFAWKPEDVAPSTAVRPPVPVSVVETTLATTTAAPRGRPVRTWVGMDRSATNLTRVTIAWEPVPDVPGSVVRESERPAGLMLKATGANNVSYFEGRVPETVLDRPPGAHAAFDAPPGTIQLRLSTVNAAGTVLDTETRNLSVKDLSAPLVAIGTPGVYRARTLPEFQRLKTAIDPTPVVAREFRRTERLLIRIPVYGPAEVQPQLTAHLLNRAGQPMAEFSIHPPEKGEPFVIEVPLAGLATGDYGVRIVAKVEGVEAAEIVAFRVTN